jgi:hypothetical protein
LKSTEFVTKPPGYPLNPWEILSFQKVFPDSSRSREEADAALHGFGSN